LGARREPEEVSEGKEKNKGGGEGGEQKRQKKKAIRMKEKEELWQKDQRKELMGWGRYKKSEKGELETLQLQW